MADISTVFSNIAKGFQHLLGDADLDKAQEAEIQATIKQLNDFEGSIDSVVDARIAAALAASPGAPAGDSTALAGRVTALEQGLQSLGHVFDGDQGADTGAGAGDDTVSGGNGSDSVPATNPADTVAGGQASDATAQA